MFVCFVQTHKVFTNRWSVFHAPVMTADFKLHPEYCQRDTDKGVDQDFEKVMTDLAQAPGAPSVTVMKLQYECMSADMHVWIRTFLKSWSDLM